MDFKIGKKVSVVAFILFLIMGTCLNVKAEDLDVSVRKNKWIPFEEYGIQGSYPDWGTFMYEISIDGGDNWEYAYCVNTDLVEPNEGFFERRLGTFDQFFNNENIQMILYYGFRKDSKDPYNSYDKDGYLKLSNTYGLWKEDDTDPTGYVLDDSDEMRYSMTHVTLSYAYYKDVLGLSEEEAAKRSLDYLGEAMEPDGVYCMDWLDCTYAQSYAKSLYERLTSMPSIGVSFKFANGKTIRVIDMDSKEIKLDEFIGVEGGNISSPTGGRIEFVVPKDMKCEVRGEQKDASDPGFYHEGDKVILGNGQSFKFSLVNPIEDFVNIVFNVYNNSNFILVEGGKDYNGDDAQDIAAYYKSFDTANKVEVKLVGSKEVVPVENPKTGINEYVILVDVALVAFLVFIVGRKYNRFITKI